MRNFLSPTGAVAAAFSASLAFWALEFHGRLPAITDLLLYTYPSQAVNLREWAKGFVPLWDAFTGCGTPQLADGLAAVFYPPFWLWNATGLSRWLVWMALLHAGWAFPGFYLWARSQRVHSLWAALGALSFAGSLHMVRCWGYPVFAAAQSWTPWIFWAAAQWFQSGRLRWWLALTLSAALQVLAGYPFFAFYALLFLGIWTFFQPANPNRKTALWLAAPAALGLSAAHWLPFLDALTYSTRGGWGGPGKFPYFIKGGEFLTLLGPNLLGDPGTSAYQGQEANAAFLLYFGLIPLAAWILGGISGKFQGRVFWGISALAWLCWMAGFPFRGLAPERWLEILDPSKAVGVFLFAALTCAGLALTRFFRDRGESPKTTAVLWLIACLWAVDVLSIPFRTVHPVPDPYQNTLLKDWAGRVVQSARGERVLGFKVHNATMDTGEGDVFEKAADDWVGNLLANSFSVWGLRGSQAYVSTWTTSMDKFWKAFNKMDTYNGILPDVAGVKVLFLPVTLSAPHYGDLGTEEGGHLLENLTCHGDAWPVYGSKVLPDQEAILSELAQSRSSADSPAEILLEAQTPELPPARRNLEIPQAGNEERFERPCGSRASYGGDFSKPGLLFWNEAFTPGWRAWVDGRPAPIERAYGFFMAVPVISGGFHQVDFRYEPTAFRLGFFLSLVFLALGPAGLLLTRKENLRYLSPPSTQRAPS